MTNGFLRSGGAVGSATFAGSSGKARLSASFTLYFWEEKSKSDTRVVGNLKGVVIPTIDRNAEIPYPKAMAFSKAIPQAVGTAPFQNAAMPYNKKKKIYLKLLRIPNEHRLYPLIIFSRNFGVRTSF
jgi:hypothetical protein